MSSVKTTKELNKSKNFSSDINNNPENIINSKDYDNDKLQTLKDFT